NRFSARAATARTCSCYTPCCAVSSPSHTHAAMQHPATGAARRRALLLRDLASELLERIARRGAEVVEHRKAADLQVDRLVPALALPLGHPLPGRQLPAHRPLARELRRSEEHTS